MQELVDRQQNITPADYPEGLHYATIPDSPKIKSLGKFISGNILVAIGVGVFQHISMTFAPLASAAIAAGLYLFIKSILWKDARK